MERLARKGIEQAYGFQIYELQEMGEGLTNKAFRAKTSQGDMFIKEYIKSSREVVREELAFTQHLSRKGVPLLLPVKNRQGEHYLKYESGLYMVYPFLEGFSTWINCSRLAEIGKAIARIHQIRVIGSLPKSRKRKFRREYYQDFLRECPDQPLTNLVKRIHHSFQLKASPLKLPKSIIHGDVWSGNFLFDQNHHLKYITDWEDVEIYFRMDDLVLGIMGLCFINHKPNFTYINSLLQGYTSDIELTKPEKNLLYDYLCDMILLMMCWRYMVFNVEKRNPKLFDSYKQHLEKYKELSKIGKKEFYRRIKY